VRFWLTDAVDAGNVDVVVTVRFVVMTTVETGSVYAADCISVAVTVV